MVGNVIDNPYREKTGTILTWPSATIPSGWLLCDGSAISRTTYKSLFNAIGTTYGVGDGSTTFNIPNISSIVKSVDTNVPINGNGKQLGFTDGTSDLVADTYSTFYAHFSKGSGLNVGAATSGDNPSVTYKAIGVTTDASKSGILGTVTRSVINFKFIIKY